MLVVWVTYLQLFAFSFFRQTRPKILINKAGGNTLGAHCIVCNMSTDPIYVTNIILTLQKDSEEWSCSITDIENVLEQADDASTKDITFQGTLKSGEFFDLGNFRKLFKQAVKRSDAPNNLAQDDFNINVMIIAVYGSERLSIAATRDFYCNDEHTIKAQTLETRQIRSIS